MAKAESNSGMELQTFITETLCSIINGVAEAQKANREAGNNALIVPVLSHARHAPEDAVEFDIAVTVAAEAGRKGEAKFRLKVPVLQIGAGLEDSNVARSSSTSRVRFKVPVSLPSTEAPPSKLAKQEPLKGIV